MNENLCDASYTNDKNILIVFALSVIIVFVHFYSEQSN